MRKQDLSGFNINFDIKKNIYIKNEIKSYFINHIDKIGVDNIKDEDRC